MSSTKPVRRPLLEPTNYLRAFEILMKIKCPVDGCGHLRTKQFKYRNERPRDRELCIDYACGAGHRFHSHVLDPLNSVNIPGSSQRYLDAQMTADLLAGQKTVKQVSSCVICQGASKRRPQIPSVSHKTCVSSVS